MKPKLPPIKECSKSRVDRYTGIREPKCNAGRGCPSCWEKYRQVQLKEMQSPKYKRTIIASAFDPLG